MAQMPLGAVWLISEQSNKASVLNQKEIKTERKSPSILGCNLTKINQSPSLPVQITVDGPQMLRHPPPPQITVVSDSLFNHFYWEGARLRQNHGKYN